MADLIGANNSPIITGDPNLAAKMRMKKIIESPNIVCSCGSKLFREVAVLKHVEDPSGTRVPMPIPVFVCDKCGEIVAEQRQSKNFAAIFGETNKSND